MFLFGENMIGQKNIKNFGDTISYYKVIGKKENNILYELVFDKLEEKNESRSL
jgi:hypothetical protein